MESVIGKLELGVSIGLGATLNMKKFGELDVWVPPHQGCAFCEEILKGTHFPVQRGERRYRLFEGSGHPLLKVGVVNARRGSGLGAQLRGYEADNQSHSLRWVIHSVGRQNVR